VKKLLYIVLACVGVSGAVPPAKAPTGLTYKYINEQGVVVLSNTIPPELAHNGYTIMNPDGSIRKVVPAELTAAQIEERDRKKSEEDAAKEAREARKRKDDELLKLYASTADVEDARDRKLRSIDTVIATTKANIVRLKQQKQHLEEQAADRERAGLLPSPEILQNLEILSTQITDKEREVEMRQMEQQQVTEQFQMDLDRVQALLGAPPVAAATTSEPTKKN
jgi:hypothetical protein